MKKTLLVMLTTCLSFFALANDTNHNQLFNELKEKDRQLFDHLYGQCVLDEIKMLFAEDFEFYHDKGGVTDNKQDFIASLKRGNCNANPKISDYKSYRVLREESFRSFPMYKAGELYAVLQTGEHEFYESYKGHNLVLTSTAKFSSLWLLSEGKWQLERVFSYDHLTPSETKK